MNLKKYNFSLIYDNEKVDTFNKNESVLIKTVIKTESYFCYENKNIYLYLKEDYINRILNNLINPNEESNFINKIKNTKTIINDWIILYIYKVNLDQDENFSVKNYKKEISFFSDFDSKWKFKLDTTEIYDSNLFKTWITDLDIILANSWEYKEIFNHKKYHSIENYIWETTIVWDELIHSDWWIVFWNYVILSTVK